MRGEMQILKVAPGGCWPEKRKKVKARKIGNVAKIGRVCLV